MKDEDACSESEPWAVVKDSDGSVEGCHATRQEAEDHMAALFASEDDEEAAVTVAADATVIVVGERGEDAAEADAGPRPFDAELVPEGIPTDDGRFMALGSISWREPPLTLLVLDENTEGGHLGAVACGHMDELRKRGLSASSAMVSAIGETDSGELGVETARKVDEGTLGGVSVDLAIREWGARDPDSGEIIAAEDLEEDDWLRLFMGGLQFAVLDGVIGAATIVPFPAFADARIVMLASGELVRIEQELLASARIPGLVEVAGELHLFVTAPFSLPRGELRACAAGPLRPPAEFFSRIRFEKPTVLTVTDEGEVFGHLEGGGCHEGYYDRCLRPDPVGEALKFHTGTIVCANGERMRVGRITVKPHARRGMPEHAVLAHYDDAERIAAYVRVWDDREHGLIACHGVTRSNASPEILRDFLANPPSIDQRRGHLLGVSTVSVPGLPVMEPEAHIVAGAEGEAVVEMLLLPPLTPERVAELVASGKDDVERSRFESAQEQAAQAALQALGENFEAGADGAVRALAESFR